MTVIERASELRLDWNECPIGPSPAAVSRVLANAEELHRYPRGLLESVTAQLAAHHRVDPDSVLLTTGVDEATDLVLARTDTAWYVDPGFDGYQARAQVWRRRTRTIPLDAGWEPIGTPQDYGMGGRDAVFLAQPNNPTGNVFRSEWISRLAESAGVVFLDATYADFDDAARLDALDDRPNVLRFHSFSKVYGLAGIRVGVLIGDPARIADLRAHSRFHAVDSIALHAVSGAVEDEVHRMRARAFVSTLRPRYVAACAQLPVFAEVRDTATNFVVARCREGLPVNELIGRLAALGVWIKDCAQFGLPGWVRITVGTAADLTRLVSALEVCDDVLTGAGGER